MKTKYANAIDFESDGTEIIEIGLTVINLEKLVIVKTMSFPVMLDRSISPEIVKLTGWTNTKLSRSGTTLAWACEKIQDNHGGKGRLTIVDCDNELESLKKDLIERAAIEMFPFGDDVINVSTLFKIRQKEFYNHSLEDMLRSRGMEFEGRQHRGDVDSRNIARLFLDLIK